MERVDLADFLIIAEIHTGVSASQLARISRTVALAQSALAAPFAGLGDYQLYPTLADKAAVYCSRIVRNHPLVDGNKRAGYDVMIEFIERNGATFSHPDQDLMATAQVIEDLAAALISEEDFRSWVAERLGTRLER